MNNLDAFKARGGIIWNIANLLRGPCRPREYHSALITAATTGKIDVHGWQPMDPSI